MRTNGGDTLQRNQHGSVDRERARLGAPVASTDRSKPLERVQRAWGDIVGALGAPSPVYPALYRAVREANIKRPAVRGTI